MSTTVSVLVLRPVLPDTKLGPLIFNLSRSVGSLRGFPYIPLPLPPTGGSLAPTSDVFADHSIMKRLDSSGDKTIPIYIFLLFFVIFLFSFLATACSELSPEQDSTQLRLSPTYPPQLFCSRLHHGGYLFDAVFDYHHDLQYVLCCSWRSPFGRRDPQFLLHCLARHGRGEFFAA